MDEPLKIGHFLSQSPLFAISFGYREVLEGFQKKLSEEGVNFTQALIILSVFFEEKPILPSKLSEVLRLTPSNISHSIKTLVLLGLIKRAADQADARKTFLSLSVSGKKKAVRLIKVFDQAQGGFEAKLGEKNLVLWCRQMNEMSLVVADEVKPLHRL